MTDDSDTLVTARLVLRRWRAGDREPMAQINADPLVTRYLNGPSDPSAIDGFLARAEDHWREHGFGWYCVEGRAGDVAGRVLGFVGVAYPTFMPAVAERPELGWRLASDVWGAGIATEAALAARDRARETDSLGELISLIHPANRRSQRVATKLGMAVEKRAPNPNLGIEIDVWQAAL